MVTVETSLGPIKVGRITWAGYIRLKRTLSKALEGPLAKMFGDVVSSGDLALGALSGVVESLGAGLAQLDQLVTDEWPELLKGAVENCPDISSLPAVEALALRSALFEVNDLGELLDAEKNWWGGVVAKVAAKMPTTSPTTSQK